MESIVKASTYTLSFLFLLFVSILPTYSQTISVNGKTEDTQNVKYWLTQKEITKKEYKRLQRKDYSIKGKTIKKNKVNPEWVKYAIRLSKDIQDDVETYCTYYKDTKQWNISFNIGYRTVSYMVSEDGIIDSTIIEGDGTYSKDGMYASWEDHDSDFHCSIFFYKNMNGHMKQIFHYFNPDIAEEVYSSDENEYKCFGGYDFQWVAPGKLILYAYSKDTLKPI